MARFAYDVNTRTRLIDVHKQFNGGLKTIDTDDALGAVYLRQAENVSLSEFGFIEKRYGTFEKDLIKTTSGTLQGYWEYLGFAIFVVDGVFYYKGTGDAVAIQRLYQESTDVYAPNTIFGEEWRYPTVFGNAVDYNQVTGCQFAVTSTSYSQTDQSTPVNQRDTCGEGQDASTKSDYTVCTVSNENDPIPEGLTHPFYTCQVYSASNTTSTAKVYTPSFPTNIDMNAVNINNVLYIFTGKYPVYVKIVQNVPRFYVFPITIPTYNEVVVTGHNLLEEDYNEIYFKNKADIQYTTPGTTTNYTTLTDDFDERPFFVVQKDSKDIEIKQHAPQIAYQDGGELDFNFKYVINPDYLEEYDAGNQDRIFLLTVDDVGYRASGPGSSGYTSSDKDAIEFTKLHNYTGSNTLQVGFDTATIARQELVKDIHDEGFDTTLPVFSQQSLQDANAEVYLLTGVAELGSNASGTLVQTAHFEMDVNTEKSGADFVPKDAFNAGDEFEFRLLTQTSDANNPTEPLFIPTTTTEIISDYFSNLPTAMLDGNGDEAYSVTMSITKQTLPKIRIVPVGENNLKFDAQIQVISLNNGLTKTSNGYKFTVPSTLVANDTVIGYEISLRGEIFAEAVLLNQNLTGLGSGSTANTTVDNSTTVALPALQIYKEMFQIETLSSGANYNLATSKNIGVKLKNLLAGTYDFRLRYRLQKFTIDSSNFLNVTNDDDGEQFTDVFFYNVPITAEKLQDFPGVTDDFLPKLKPIWTCNKVMEHYGKLMVWGSTEMPTAVFYSFPDRPTYFPSKFYLDFSNDTNQKIEAVTPYMNILVAQTASQTWGIRGNSGLIDAPAPYVPFGINGTVGTISYKSVRPVRNHLFFLSRQGVIALKSLYAADEQYNIDFVDRNIRNIVPQDSEAVGIQFDNQYWLNFPNNSITLRWYIDKKAWLKDVYQGWNTTDDESDFEGVFKYQIVDGKLEFITYPSVVLNDSNSYIYKIGIEEGLPTDLFQPIKAKIETSFLNQNYPFHPKNYKEAKLDFTLQNEYNKGRVSVIDSSSSSETAQIQYNTNDITVQAADAVIKNNHRYRVDFYINEQTTDGVTTYDNVDVSTISVEGTNVTKLPQLTDSEGNTIPSYIFEIPNSLVFSDPLDIVFHLNAAPTYNSSTDYIVIRDVTYDDTLTFDTYIISEDQTLNFNNYSGYDQASVDVGVDLTEKERLGDWKFGTSDFGKKVTAVKTIKLSGKGYNAKLYLEDTSRSKWTLESLGITYKMKRARSR